MSLPACLKVGSGTGLVGGLISSAFLSGAAKQADKNDNPSAFAIGLLSVGSLISGPIVGAGIGFSYYGLKKSIKYLRDSPKAIQVVVLAIAGLGLTMKGAYTLGERGNLSQK